jgi:hypothetical protein
MWQDCAILLIYSALRLQVTKVSALFDNVISDVRLLRDSSDQWQAFLHAGRGLIPGQPLWNLWWKKWHLRFVSRVHRFLLFLSLHEFSIFGHLSVTNAL